MARRVGLVVADGTELGEAVLAALSIERAGGEAVFFAPDATLPVLRSLSRGTVAALSSANVEQLDMLVFPGGSGVGTTLSNYDDKGALCVVHPEVVRLLRAAHSRRRPLGFICLAPILAARVLGPIAGVRVTLGHKGTPPDKHAAVMGADVRHCPLRDIVVDEKARVVSTPGYMYEEARLSDVAIGVDKLVRALFTLAKPRGQRPPGPPTPGRGSVGSGPAPSGTRPPRSPSPPRGS